MNHSNQKNNRRPVSASAVTRLVIWSVVLCILVAVLIVGLLPDFAGLFTGLSMGGFRYDDSGYHVGGGSSDERITDISVEWLAGSVTVVPAEGDEISISDDYRGEDKDLELRWVIRNGELSVKYRAPAWILKSTVNKNLTLAIPASMLENLREVEIEGVDCDVHFEGNADELSLDMVDGAVDIRGDIGELSLNAVNGGLTFRGGVREAELDCVDAEAVMHLEMGAELNFDFVDGDVTLYLSDEITGFSAEMDLVDGDLALDGFDGATVNGRKSARWGDGGLRILVDGVDCQLNIKKETKD